MEPDPGDRAQKPAFEAEWVELPPTQDELPYDDGQPMETQRHKLQMELLIDALGPWLEAREDGYVGGNTFVYYSLDQTRLRDFKGPDFFVALDVPKGERKSWVVWEEGKAPDAIVELLSPSTAAYDKTEKLAVYRDRLRVPEYFWYHPFDPDDFAGFVLNGCEYVPIAPDARDRLPCRALGLFLARWTGVYKGVEATWLRWETPEGDRLPTDGERAAAAIQEAERERQRADRLAELLRERGIDPDSL